MLYLILLGLFVYSGNVDVETAYSDMAVTAEIVFVLSSIIVYSKI